MNFSDSLCLFVFQFDTCIQKKCGKQYEGILIVSNTLIKSKHRSSPKLSTDTDEIQPVNKSGMPFMTLVRCDNPMIKWFLISFEHD